MTTTTEETTMSKTYAIWTDAGEHQTIEAESLDAAVAIYTRGAYDTWADYAAYVEGIDGAWARATEDDVSVARCGYLS